MIKHVFNSGRTWHFIFDCIRPKNDENESSKKRRTKDEKSSSEKEENKTSLLLMKVKASRHNLVIMIENILTHKAQN